MTQLTVDLTRLLPKVRIDEKAWQGRLDGQLLQLSQRRSLRPTPPRPQTRESKERAARQNMMACTLGRSAKAAGPSHSLEGKIPWDAAICWSGRRGNFHMALPAPPRGTPSQLLPSRQILVPWPDLVINPSQHEQCSFRHLLFLDQMGENGHACPHQQTQSGYTHCPNVGPRPRGTIELSLWRGHVHRGRHFTGEDAVCRVA